MPTVLLLTYKSYSEVTLSNDLAEKLQKSGKWYDKWGSLRYEDDEGKIHVIEGKTIETDFKRSYESEWMKPEPEKDDYEEKRVHLIHKMMDLKNLPNVTYTKVEVTVPTAPMKCSCSGCRFLNDDKTE